VAFTSSVAKAFEALPDDENGVAEMARQFERCRAARDRAGMRFWVDVGAYGTVTAMHGHQSVQVVRE
jgi:hypothetical protein